MTNKYNSNVEKGSWSLNTTSIFLNIFLRVVTLLTMTVLSIDRYLASALMIQRNRHRCKSSYAYIFYLGSRRRDFQQCSSCLLLRIHQSPLISVRTLCLRETLFIRIIIFSIRSSTLCKTTSSTCPGFENLPIEAYCLICMLCYFPGSNCIIGVNVISHEYEQWLCRILFLLYFSW